VPLSSVSSSPPRTEDLNLQFQFISSLFTTSCIGHVSISYNKNTIHTSSSYVQHIIYLSCTQPSLNSLSLYYLIHPYELLPSLFFSLDFIYPCYVGPCHHGMARPQVADGGTASSYGG
jgi:hypothetical protein